MVKRQLWIRNHRKSLFPYGGAEVHVFKVQEEAFIKTQGMGKQGGLEEHRAAAAPIHLEWLTGLTVQVAMQALKFGSAAPKPRERTGQEYLESVELSI